MARELGALYVAVANNAETHGSVAAGYADYLDMVQYRVPPEARAADETYWLEKLAGTLPRLDLPSARPRPAVQTYNGARLRRDLEADLAERAAAITAQYGCTKFGVLLAGFRALLYALVKSDDALIGISAAGQATAGSSDLVGCCVNVLPLRFAVDPGDTFRDLLAASRDNVLGALEHHQVSLVDLAAKLGIPRDPSRAPLIDIHFNFDKVESGISFGALDVALQTNHFGFVRRDLTWNPVETGDGLSLVCDFNTDLFDAPTVSEWMADYGRLLDIATRQPDLTLAGLAEALTAAKAGSLKIVSGSRLQQARRKTVGLS
jgi:non-ribosomal peptide synthetase component F